MSDGLPRLVDINASIHGPRLQVGASQIKVNIFYFNFFRSLLLLFIDSVYTLQTAQVIVNMWRLVPQDIAPVHIVLFDFDRLNPRTQKIIKLKKDQKYQPCVDFRCAIDCRCVSIVGAIFCSEDIKAIQAAGINHWLKQLGKENMRMHACGDGKELIIVNANVFSVVCLIVSFS